MIKQSVEGDISCLKENVVLTAHPFLHISLGQYDGFVYLLLKQVTITLQQGIFKANLALLWKVGFYEIYPKVYLSVF